MHDLLFSTAFTVWGVATSWAEAVAVVLALAMVGMNIRERHWGWPLAILSSILYFFIFQRSQLYGDAALQVFFILLAGWGWTKWLRGRRADGSALVVSVLSGRGRLGVLLAWALLWPALGLFLLRFTDTDVPWWDAFPTAGSLVGQYLLARKYTENWPAWLAVNVAGAALYAYKGLWITALLYAVFAMLSVSGWRAWQARSVAAA
ncbi:nicotinamide riboside transporter PnuC [Xylophilus rhododendri]|uniref:Nicotinamide riboside transporter PnuC n=1 Tax=Xylophilus rhododendri TaxID=2697032 RepID=A0A857J240_9BURK|nr:nicotinamide riboside transporter PnuC [Xylophilus rhododendri]QHI97303.1 nicotinamide riboside transporter PnuC [Xylophilus rhododendri]